MTSPDADPGPHGWGEPPAPQYGQRVPPGAPVPVYGQPAADQPPVAPPAGGQPQYGQYGPTGYHQPQYGQSQYGQPQYGQAQYGPQPGQPGYAPQPAAALRAARPGVIPLRPLSLGEIFDGAFNAVRRNVKVMLGLTLAVVGVCVVVFTLLAAAVTPWLDARFGSLTTDLDDSSELTLGFTGAVLTTSLGTEIGMVLAGAVVTGILVVAISEVVLGARPSARDVWTRTRRRVWALIGVSLLSGLIALVVVGVPVTVLVLGIWQESAVTIVVGVLLLLLSIPAVVWVSVSLSFAPAVVVLEESRVLPALRRSWRLVRSSFWRVLGITLLAVIIVAVVQQIIGVPIGVIAGIVGATSGNDVVVIVLSTLSSILGYTIGIAFSATVTSLLYIDVRMRREGLDVQLAAAASAPRR